MGKLQQKMLNGAQGRIRTTDTRIFSPLLYQLSYLGGAGERERAQAGKRLIGQKNAPCPWRKTHSQAAFSIAFYKGAPLGVKGPRAAKRQSPVIAAFLHQPPSTKPGQARAPL